MRKTVLPQFGQAQAVPRSRTAEFGGADAAFELSDFGVIAVDIGVQEFRHLTARRAVKGQRADEQITLVTRVQIPKAMAEEATRVIAAFARELPHGCDVVVKRLG